MPKIPRPPSYRYHKATRQAVVVIRGASFYLGPWNSPDSHAEYRRVIAEHWSTGAKTTPPPPAPGKGATPAAPASRPGLSVAEVILEFWNRRVLPYYVKDGRPTSERDNIRQALRFLRRAYGHTPARDFGALGLKAVRQTMIEAGRCRTLINKDVHRIRGMFRWAAGEELYPGPSLAALDAVEALTKGRSDAKEHPPVGVVPEATVLATLPHLSPQVAAMVRLQLLTAARPGEVGTIRPRDIDRSDPACWVYRPESHKTEHHGRERVIPIGPKAQEVLRPWLDRAPDAYCFSPAEVVEARTPGATTAPPKPRRKGREQARRPKPGGRYTKDSYRTAVARACDRAFLHLTLAKIPAKKLTPEQRGELAAWRKAHRWHPHQLRHTQASVIRREFDSEAAQVILGHSKPDTTMIYAERDLERAKAVMRQVG